MSESTAVAAPRAAHRQSLLPWPRRYTILALIAIVLVPLGALDQTSIDTFDVMGVLTPILIIVGIRHYRPSPQWPWWAMFMMGTLSTVSAGLRSHYETLGNLTITRTIIPDVISIPGYLFLVGGLIGFTVVRNRTQKNRLGAIYDGVIAGLAIFGCLWAFLIEPILSHAKSPESVRFILIAYPALSLFFVVITIQLAFGSNRRRSAAERLLLATMFCVFAGDMLSMLAEVGKLPPNLAFIVLPYSLAYLGFAACVLDPSMKTLTEPTTETRPNWSAIRIALVAVAFIVPAILVLDSHDYPTDERIVLFGVVIALTGTAILQIVQALRAVQSSEGKLKFQSLHDALTGLPNRVFLEQYLKSQYSGPRPAAPDVTVLFFDLDRFKLINDTLGHSQGDQLLIKVAERLRKNVRPTDLVTRIGGDEFVVVLGEALDISQASEFANRLRTSLTEPIVIDDSEFFVTASIGLAHLPASAGELNADSLLRDADTAMYQAKEAGRDSVAVFDDAMRIQLEQRVEVERDLRHAVERNELHLVYQPIVSMLAHDVLGMEALVRWAHPTLGVLLPLRFIPLAEESDLISEIGSWVLSEALRQVAICRAQPGLEDFHVAVNLSAIQLHDELLVQRVSCLLNENKLPGSALVLELTESAMMANREAAIATLAGLRRLGIPISIDDFGTEYSSLAYLQQLPIDSLKIDRSFVTPLQRDDSSSESLVAAIVAMADALKLDTIAEGIETVEQLERLVALGCDAAEGYYFARPVRSDQLLDVIALLSRNNARSAAARGNLVALASS